MQADMRVFVLIFSGWIFGLGSMALAEHTPLEEKMSAVNKTLKGLRRSSGDHAKCVSIVRTAQKHLLECFQYPPSMLEKVEDAKKKDEILANYKKELAESYITLCELELAYLSGDPEKIKAANQLVKRSKKEGHDEFID